MAACSSNAYALAPNTSAVDLNGYFWTRTPAPPTPTPTLTASPAPSATPTPLAAAAPVCNQSNGAVIADQIISPALGYGMDFRAYLPPCYAIRQRELYPVLYLLPGLRQDESAWDQIGVDETADRLIGRGDIPPLIIIMPGEADDDRFGAALLQDLMPYIEANYRALTDRRHRALGGLSRGAGWTAHIGFQRPELFGALGIHSVAIFYSDERSVYRWLNAAAPEDMPRIYLDIGEDDSLLYSAEWLDDILTQRGVGHEFVVNPGGHTTAYWRAHLIDYLRWYTAEW